MKHARFLWCLGAFAALAGCKTQSGGATTKDALVPTGPRSGSTQPFALFVNDAAHQQVCALDCNDTNPVQPNPGSLFADKLRCNIDMYCEGSEAFLKFFLAESKQNGTTSWDAFYASLVAGFTVYSDQTFAAEAAYLITHLKSVGKHQPVGQDLADKYLTRKVTDTFSGSSNPATQKQIDAALTQLNAAREKQRLADEAEARRQAELERQREAAAVKAAAEARIAAVRTRLGGFNPWRQICPADDGTTKFQGTALPQVGVVPPSEGLTVAGQESACLNAAFGISSTQFALFSIISAPNHTFEGTRLIALFSADAAGFNLWPEFGDDVNGFHTTLTGDDAFRVLNQLNVGFTSPDVIDLVSFSKALVGDGSAKPNWEIRCTLAGTDGGAFPRCQVDINRTMNHQRAIDQAANAGQQAILDFAAAAPMRLVGYYQHQVAGSYPVILVFNPAQFIRYFTFNIGDNCNNVGLKGGDVSTAGAAGTTVTAVDTLKTRKDDIDMVYLVNNGNGGWLTQINVDATGGVCSDVAYYSN